MTHMSSMSCPSLLQHCSRLQCRAGVYPAWHFTLLHRGPARPLPLLTEWSAPIPAWWSLVKDQPCMPRTLTGSGSAPTVQMQRKVSMFVDSTAAHSLARWEGGLPRVRDVLPGRGGLDRNHQGARLPRRVRPLRSDQPRSVSGLPCGLSFPDRAHTYDHQRYDWR